MLTLLLPIIMILCILEAGSKQAVKFTRHLPRNLAFRDTHLQILVHVSDLGTVMPVDDGSVAAALLVNAEVRKGVQLALDPDIGDYVAVGIAHEVLQDDVDAVIRMDSVQGGEVSVWIPVSKVVSPVHVAADGVEAVDRVHNVQLGNVRLGPKPPVLGPPCRPRRVLAQPKHILSADHVR